MISTVTIPRCYNVVNANSFFPCTARLFDLRMIFFDICVYLYIPLRVCGIFPSVVKLLVDY